MSQSIVECNKNESARDNRGNHRLKERSQGENYGSISTDSSYDGKYLTS